VCASDKLNTIHTTVVIFFQDDNTFYTSFFYPTTAYRAKCEVKNPLKYTEIKRITIRLLFHQWLSRYTPNKKRRYPLNRRLSGLQNQSRHFEEKNLCPASNQSPDHPAHSLFPYDYTIQTPYSTSKHNKN
jgi:hypothetical protein